MFVILAFIMPDELIALKTVIERLEKGAIPYMVSGSMAAAHYSTPRMTRDIDIVVEIGALHVQPMMALFSKDFYIDEEMIGEAVKEQRMFNVIHNATMVKIDFVVRKNEPYRQTEFKRRKQVQFGDIKIWIVSAEDLVISKLFWAKDSHSEQQLKDVENIMQSQPNIDRPYMESWIKSLGLEKLYERYRSSN